MASGQLGDLIVRIGADVSGFAAGMSSVSGQLSAVDKEATKAGAGFTRIGQSLTSIGTGISAAVTLPLLGAGLVATKFASDFELGMRQVTSLIGGATQKEFADLSAATLKLAKDMGIDAVGATRALYEAISAGIPKDNALDFVAVASVAAVAGLTDSKIAVNALTTVIAAYGLQTTEAKELSDAMFQAVNIGKFQFADLAAEIGPAAQMSSALGVSYQELLAATATLSITTGSAGKAVTQVESAMRALLNPTAEMAVAFKAIGVTSGSAAIKAFGFEGTLQKLRVATGGNVEAFTQLFGRIEGSQGALGLTGEKAVTAAKDLDTMRHASDGLGAATVAYNEINKSTQRQLEMTLNQLKATAIEMGTALLPAVNSLLKASQPLLGALADMVSWFGKLPSGVQTAAISMVAGVAAIGPLVLIAGQASIAIGGIAKAMALLPAGTALLTAAFSGLVPAIGSVVVALQVGMVGALTAGELALLGIGGALAVVGAAFAGWKIGLWIADLEIANPLLRFLRDILFGVNSAAQALARKGLSDAEKSAEKLQVKLAALGVIVPRGSMDITAYSKALLDAATQHGKTGVSVTALTSGLKAGQQVTQTSTEKTKALKDAEKALKEELDSLDAEMKNDLVNAKYYEDQKKKLAAASKALADEEKALNAEMAELARTTPYVGSAMQEVMDKLAAPVWDDAGRNVTKITDAYKTLGITVTTADLQKKADDLRAAYETLKAQGEPDILVLQQAWVKVQEAEKAAKAAVGEWTPAMEEALQASKSKLSTMEGHIGPLKNKWKELGATIKGDVTSAIEGMERALIDWDWEGFKNSLVGMFKEIGFSVLDSFIKPAKEAIATFISETITDLLSGKGLGGVLQNVKDIGSTMADVFGGGAKTASDVASGAGSAAGGAANAVAGGLTGWLGAIGSIGSMISGFIGNFQTMKTNDRLWNIEDNTRKSMNYLGERADGGILGALFKISETLAWGPAVKAVERIRDEMLLLGAPYINPSLDTLKSHAESIRNSLFTMQSGGQSQDITVNLQVDGETLATIVTRYQAGQLRLAGAPA
jgi:TP901 family phage tail tape measure protein